MRFEYIFDNYILMVSPLAVPSIYLQSKDSGQYGIWDGWDRHCGWPAPDALDPLLLADDHRLRASEVVPYY